MLFRSHDCYPLLGIRTSTSTILSMFWSLSSLTSSPKISLQTPQLSLVNNCSHTLQYPHSGIQSPATPSFHLHLYCPIVRDTLTHSSPVLLPALSLIPSTSSFPSIPSLDFSFIVISIPCITIPLLFSSNQTYLAKP